MVIVELTEPVCRLEIIEYPCLRVDAKNGDLILFTAVDSGTIVFSVDGGENSRLVGNHYENLDARVMLPYYGVVSLRNAPRKGK